VGPERKRASCCGVWTVGSLFWRRELAAELAHMDKLHKRLEDRIAYIRLERDRCARLRAELTDAGLDRAIEHLDAAALELGAIRAQLENIQ
jgi:hypothetical protein